MSDKRWLIRTRSKQILGPTSKEKIISLIEKSSLLDEDEVSSGNGYWFWIKEKNLIDKYLYNGEKQKFNPISEAESLFSAEKENENIIESQNESDVILPKDEDLEFPDVGISDDTIELELNQSQSSITDDGLQDKVDDEVKAVAPVELIDEEEVEEVNEDVAVTSEETDMPKVDADKGNTKKKGRHLSLLLLIMILILLSLGVVYYYHSVLNRPIPFLGISNVQAQTITSLIKKKVHLS